MSEREATTWIASLLITAFLGCSAIAVLGRTRPPIVDPKPLAAAVLAALVLIAAAFALRVRWCSRRS